MIQLFVCLVYVSSLAVVGAQGELWFANTTATRITNGLTGLPAPGGPAQDDTQVGLYFGNYSDPVSSLQLWGAVTNCYLPGYFAGGIRRNIETTFVQLQVRAWLASTVYPTYEAALTGALAGDTSVLLGVSVPMFAQLIIPPGPPLSLADYGLNSITLMPIPEPSAWALLALGAVAAVLLARPKRRGPQ